MPLTWISFNANRSGKDVLLEWQTANEVNTGNFVIERQDGDNPLRSIGTIGAQLLSMNYKFRDVNSQPSLVLRNNPVNTGMLSFDVSGYPNGKAAVAVFNSIGKKIPSTEVWLSANSQTINIPVQEPPSVYLLTVRLGNLFNQRPFIIIR